jgi:putative transposase
VERKHSDLSVCRQCELLDVNRSTLYAKPKGMENPVNLFLMTKIDQIYTNRPYYGSRRIAVELRRRLGWRISRKRVQRLMRKMGIEGICPRRNTSKPAPGHEVFPYLLRNVTVDHVDQVWSTDITYLPMKKGFMYLVAIIDWFSRHVITWRLSNTMDSSFCVAALEDALATGRCPEIFNTDQGSQFTSKAFLAPLKDRGIAISMDGRGRALDNVFIERLWRSVKYECVYLHDYDSPFALNAGLAEYFQFYNTKRPHQSLDYRMPAEIYLNQEAQKQGQSNAESAGLSDRPTALRRVDGPFSGRGGQPCKEVPVPKQDYTLKSAAGCP